MGGGLIIPSSLKTKRNPTKFQARPNFCLFFKSYCLLYLLIIVFPKFGPLSATGMALFVYLGPKCQNLSP
jgi:hypothetical protein